MTKLNKRILSIISAGVIMVTLPGNALADPEAEKQIEQGNLFLQDKQSNTETEQEIENGNLMIYSGAPEDIDTEGSEGEGETENSEDTTAPTESVTPAGGEEDDPYLDPEYTETPDPTQEGEGIEEPSGTASITGSDVKIRAEANTESEILFYLPNGVQVDILGQEGDWYKVRYGIVEGYVYNQYLFVNSDDGRNGIIIEDGVNMRSGASTNTEAITKLEVGSVTKVIGYEEGWYKVEYSEKTGYVNRDYIKVSGKYTGETSRVISEGMSGEEVKNIQEALKKRGFFVGETTEDYGSKTMSALKDFQKAAGVDEDGIAGQSTLELLYGDNNIRKTISDASQVKGLVKLTEWNEVNKIIGRGETFKVIDVNTGITWKERRMGGWYHIDTEPLTAEDSANMKKAYGGTWSWDRRAVWVIYGDQVFAASMNGMPHLGSTIGGNNFNGHHCIHFYKSKVHANSKQCPRHQAKVQEAYAQGN